MQKTKQKENDKERKPSPSYGYQVPGNHGKVGALDLLAYGAGGSRPSSLLALLDSAVGWKEFGLHSEWQQTEKLC